MIWILLFTGWGVVLFVQGFCGILLVFWMWGWLLYWFVSWCWVSGIGFQLDFGFVIYFFCGIGLCFEIFQIWGFRIVRLTFWLITVVWFVLELLLRCGFMFTNFLCFRFFRFSGLFWIALGIVVWVYACVLHWVYALRICGFRICCLIMYGLLVVFWLSELIVCYLILLAVCVCLLGFDWLYFGYSFGYFRVLTGCALVTVVFGFVWLGLPFRVVY